MLWARMVKGSPPADILESSEASSELVLPSLDFWSSYRKVWTSRPCLADASERALTLSGEALMPWIVTILPGLEP